jgi:hypothetical protein
MPRAINMNSLFETAAAAQKSKSNKTPTDTLAAAQKMFGKGLENIKVGAGFPLPIPDEFKGKEMNFMAQARGKLTSVVREGQPLAGRVYETKLSEIDGKKVLLFRRGEDAAVPLKAKKGGRKSAAQKAAEAEAAAAATAKGGDKSSVQTAKDAAKAHLGGSPDGKVEKPPVKDLTN